MKTRTFLIVFLINCIGSSVYASVIKEKKGVKETAIVVYLGIVKCKNEMIFFIKNHPFISAAIIVTLISKKMRQTLKSLPQNILHDAQEYPVVMALLGGFILSYLVT